MTHIVVTFHDRAIPDKGYYYNRELVVEIGGKELIINNKESLEKAEKESGGLILGDWSKCRFFKGKQSSVEFSTDEENSLELLYLVIKKGVKVVRCGSYGERFDVTIDFWNQGL